MANLRQTILLTGGLWLAALAGTMLALPASAASRVTAMGDSSCAIAPDGAVQCWGIDAPFDTVPGRAAFIEGFPDDLVAIAGPAYSLCGLTAGGGVLCKGYYPGDGASDFTETPLAPVGMSGGVIDVSRSYGHVCAVKDDGSVWCWGSAWYGLGDAAVTTYSLAPVEVLPASFHARGVSVGLDIACTWNQSGELRCWGANYYGQVGVGNVGDTVNTPTAVAGVANVLGVDTYLDHSCAVVVGGAVYCWGNNNYRQLGDDTETDSPTPVLASHFTGTNVADVAVGEFFTCVQSTSGDVNCTGANYYGQAAPSGSLQADAGQISLGHEHGCVLASGEAECWGNNAVGQLGNGRPGSEYLPVALANGAVAYARAPHPGWQDACTTLVDGTATCWGQGYRGSGEPGPFDPLQHYAVQNTGGEVMDISVGTFHRCALRDDGTVRCWGSNFNGQLGDGTTDYHDQPMPVAGLAAAATQLAVGGAHNCAVLVDKTVACWGRNDRGQAGGTDYQNRLTAQAVSGLTNVLQVSAGDLSSCAVNGSGEVWCWGNNYYGQLGNGDTTDSATPVQALGIANAIQVSVGGYNACATLADGHVACWGYGWSGELGDGAFDNSSTPVQVDSTASFAQVSAGHNHVCGRTESNDVLCWGSSLYGQLGSGDIYSAGTPMPIAFQAVDLYARENATCALGVDGKAYCWGANEQAQLGIGQRGISEVPVAVVGFGDGIFDNGFD